MPTCHDWMFRCGNERCVPYWWKCDGINDCGDESDEIGCTNNTVTMTTTTEPPITQTEMCLSSQFMCDSKRCISKSDVCDGIPDCSNGEDEINCPKNLCGRDKFRYKLIEFGVLEF